MTSRTEADADRQASRDLLQRVILIHGTAAADPSDYGESWWQTDSRFQKDLAQRLGPSFIFERPFHWSGANSEAGRRDAAEALLARLRSLDVRNASYHLVAHSHGGSLVWRALQLSMQRSRQPLQGLRSWCTVGTPFLDFATARLNGFMVPAVGLIIAAMTGTIYHIGRYVHGEAGVVLSSPWGLLSAALAIALVGYGLIVTGYLLRLIVRKRYAGREAQVAREAALAYSDRWLGLWHPADEAMNGLALTLTETQPITPRIRPRHQWLAWARLPLTLYNAWLARAADEYVWKQLVSSAQGNDVGLMTVVGVFRSPRVFGRAWPQLPASIVERMTLAADRHAASSLAETRKTLSTALVSKDPSVVLAHLKEGLTFQELIHTTYFADEENRELVAGNMLRQAPSAATPPGDTVPSMSTSWLSADPDQSTAEVREPLSPIALQSLVSLGTVGAGALLALSAISAFNAWVRPQTQLYQIEHIVARVDGDLLNIHGKEASAKMLVRLHRLGEKERIWTLLDGIHEPSAYVMAASKLAEVFGSEADRISLEKLLGLTSRRQRIGDGWRRDLIASFVKGAARAQHVAAVNAIAKDALGALQELKERPTWRAAELAIGLAATGSPAAVDAAAFLGTDFVDSKDCAPSHQVPAFFVLDQTDRLDKYLAKCRSADDAPRLWYEAADALIEFGLTDKALQALERGFERLQASSTPKSELVQEYLKRFVTLQRWGTLRSFFISNAKAKERRWATSELVDLLVAHQQKDLALLVFDPAKGKEGRMERLIKAGDVEPLLLMLGGIAPVGQDIRKFIDMSIAVGRIEEAREFATLGPKFFEASRKQKIDQDTILGTIHVAEALRIVGMQREAHKMIGVILADISNLKDVRQRALLFLDLLPTVLSSRYPDRQAAIELTAKGIAARDEFQDRSRKFAELARLLAADGNLVQARFFAEKTSAPEDLLGAFNQIIDSYSALGRTDSPRLTPTPSPFEKSRVDALLEEAKREGVFRVFAVKPPLTLPPWDPDLTKMVCEALK